MRCLDAADPARDSQADILALLAKESSAPLVAHSKSFWVSNQLYIRDATLLLVFQFAQMPGVASIAEEHVWSLPKMHIHDATSFSNSTPMALPIECGIARIGAPDVWTSGNKAEGVVVGVIDTRAYATHEALAGSYRGAYNWFDPKTNATEAYDSFGHGSHVTGTIAGDTITSGCARCTPLVPTTKWRTPPRT